MHIGLVISAQIPPRSFFALGSASLTGSMRRVTDKSHRVAIYVVVDRRLLVVRKIQFESFQIVFMGGEMHEQRPSPGSSSGTSL